MKSRLVLLLVLVLLAGCARAPARTEPDVSVDVPAQWTNRDLAPEPGSIVWWEQFHDPGLDTVVTAALSYNHDLLAAAARVDEATGLARIAGADLYPQVNLALGATRAKRNYIGLPFPGADGEVQSAHTTQYDAGLDLSWEIDLWGRIRSGKSAAMADVQATFADYQGARLSLAGRASKAWFQVIEARQQMELARRTVESYERTADQVRDRFVAGVRSSLDLRLALSNLATGQGRLETRKRQYDAAVRRLEVLMGRYPSGSLTAAADLPAMPAAVPGGLPADLISRRPDLTAAERRLAAADARVSQSKAALYPRISLTASGGTSTSQLEDIVNADFSVWSLLGNLVQPIFQGGRLRAQVKVSEARTRQAFEGFASTAIQAYSEVEGALFAENVLALEEQRYLEAAEQAVGAQLVAEEEYRAGLADFITVLESQRRALQAQSEAYLIRRIRLEARVDLHLALGGGFQADPPAPATADQTPPNPDGDDES